MQIVQSSKFKVQSLVLVLMLFSTYNVQAQGLFNFDGIPAPPQSEEIETHKEQAEINQMTVTSRITHYQSPLSPEVIIGFYQHNLPSKGWQSLSQAVKTRGGIAAFSKGKENLNISAFTLTDGLSDIYITRSVIPQDIPFSNIQKGQDTPGKDLPWAPRYPGATRTLSMYNKKTGGATVSYVIDAEAEEVIDFYKDKLANSGWRFVNDIKLAQLPGIGSGSFTTLFFEGFRGQCQVSVNRRDNLKQGQESLAVAINYVP